MRRSGQGLGRFFRGSHSPRPDAQPCRQEESRMRRIIGSLVAIMALGLLSAAPAMAQTAVGSDKCAKACHKVELSSWAATKHATGEKKVDCETCHGKGSGFMMVHQKDKAKAVAAGFVAKPEKATCSAAGCHKAAEVTDAMVAKVHEHKPPKPKA
jgi:hypothetical protein